jgi:hypothetical protein
LLAGAQVLAQEQAGQTFFDESLALLALSLGDTAGFDQAPKLPLGGDINAHSGWKDIQGQPRSLSSS